MKQRAIIFDMDGTIVDSTEAWHYATRSLIERRGYVMDTPEVLALLDEVHGLAIHETCARLKSFHQWTDPLEVLIAEKRNAARIEVGKRARLISGFAEFYAQIREQKIPSGVATNSDAIMLAATDSAVNLQQFFGQHLYAVDRVQHRGKPRPDIYLYVAQQLGVDPQHCVAVEDSAHGIAAAKAAGMACIGINTSKNLQQMKEADFVIEGYEGLSLASVWERV